MHLNYCEMGWMIKCPICLNKYVRSCEVRLTWGLHPVTARSQLPWVSETYGFVDLTWAQLVQLVEFATLISMS